MCADPLNGAAFGLLGEKLGHSWSRQIHLQLGAAAYGYAELPRDEAARFIREGAWTGINVTIPYKALAAELADERSPRVEATSAANTLVRRDDGRIFAENTDVIGFSRLLERFCARELGAPAHVALADAKALVLGSGGASAAVVYALAEAGARPTVISRTGDEGYEGLAERHADAALIVNATPVGMYPDCPQNPLPAGYLASFPQLKGVIDVIYNPLATGLLLEAATLGIAHENGLFMLVAQAHAASELFQGRPLAESLIDDIEREIASSMRNVVLIGMPGAGKSTTGKRLARLMGRPFVDLDEAIASGGRTPAQIIVEDGEDAFRAIETGVAREYGARSGLVISCGGGIVTRDENRPLIAQNGVLVFLDRPIDGLSSAGRPLSQAAGTARLAEERMWRYRTWADISLSCTGSAAGDAKAIVELLA